MTPLPAPLTELPWKAAPKDAAPEGDPVLLPGLEPPAERRIAWTDGEREEWAKARPYGHWKDGEWERAAQEFRSGRMGYEPTRAGFLAQGPEELVRPLLAEWRPGVHHDFFHSLQPVVRRFGLEALDAALHAARSHSGTARALLPFLDAEVARQMADRRYRSNAGRGTGDAWLDRHGPSAVPYLVPDALGKRRVPRVKALSALHRIAAVHGPEKVVDAARELGGPAADAVAQALARPCPPMPSDPEPDAQQAPPALPGWADADALPAPVTPAGPLPPSAVRNLLTMLAMTRHPDRYPGLDKALAESLAVCTPASLAAFGWALFEAWRAAGMPGREGWALEALGRLGDDDTVRALTPLINEWPGQSGHHRAVLGLGVLAAIGTDTALVHLAKIAARCRYTGLRERAAETLDGVAAARGLTAGQLADRLVPDLGLDASGGLTLDYGPRRFTVGFDEQLRPLVRDQDGRPRKDLPKPGVKDDPELAPAARKRFAALKKEVRSVATDQVRRLETAMVEGRRWTAAEFGAFVVDHPLMGHLARRLVWLCEDGPEVSAFRVAEDRTFTDAADDAFALPESASVGVAHPLELAGDLAAWRELFADYEIGQPFPQLDRPCHVLDEEQRAGFRLHRFEGVTVPTGRVLGLTRHGWRRGVPQDNGYEHWIWKPLPDGVVAVVALDPGITVGAVDLFPEQRTTGVWVGSRPDWSPPASSPARLGDLDGVVVSELVADLVGLTGAEH